MNILKIAYKLSKTVLGSSLKKEVSIMMSEINKSQEMNLGEKLGKYDRGKSIRNQSAKNAHIHFLGYLIADSKRKEIEKEFDCLVPELSKKHITLLIKVHREFINMNEKIINLLPNNLTHKSVLNPYNMYENIVSQDSDFESSVFTEVQLDNLQSSFRKHRAFQEIAKIPIDLYADLNLISNDKINEGHYIFTDKIYKAGVMSYPQELVDVVKSAKRGNAILPVKYIYSLMCIKESIYILNQLIYQAFFQEKLAVYNDDNLISIKSSSHYGGKGYTLKSQHEYDPQIKDLVHVISPFDNGNIPVLCQVESVITNFGGEFGSDEDLELRTIDEDLNPFRGILDFSNY